jgi:diguanylate cyclase (GGDEF)-like protein/PAS domain S-box-containing protein
VIQVPQDLRVAVVGPGATRAHDVFASLAQAGYHGRGFVRFTRLLEAKREWCATILLADPEREYPEEELAALQELAVAKPLIIAGGSIDMALVRQAAALGARDVVLRGDAQRLIDSLRRAVAESVEEAELTLVGEVEDQLMRRVFDLTPNYVSIRDAAGRFVIVSQAFADLYGMTVEQMSGKPIAAYTPTPEEAAREAADDAEVLQSRRSRFDTREIVDSAGRQRLIQTVKRPITLDDGRVFVMSVGVDITRPRRAESTLEKTNAFLKNILETISDAVFALDLSGKFTLANQRLSQMTGYKHHQLIGMPFTQIFASDSLDEVQRVMQSAAADAHKEKRFEGQVSHADGHQRIITCSLLPLRQGESIIGIVGTAIDVTERKAAEQRIEHLAYHDPLTNLPNRRLLGDRLKMAMSQAQRDRRMVALLFVDLDRFKSINDSLGHRIGDALLQELGTRFRHCVRSGDTVARMGGDEFVFLLPAVEHAGEAVTVARKVLDAVRKPFAIEGREFVVTACIGISLYPNHAQDAETLIKQADTALFESKRRGSDTYELFDESMSARSMNHFILENDLRRAISQGELALFYQPIVEMRTERIIALEALVRWNHPARGLLMPDDFIRLAEETGLIMPLGDWVLREACRQNREWQERGVLAVPVAVNISARQLDSDLTAAVQEALAVSSLAPEFLDLELTETILMESAASSSMTVDALKKIGTRISVDDFGTGYSSLGYLDRFPIDALKIDRSFMPHDPLAPGAGVIAGTIISMAQSLGIDVVAEGVETREQRDFLLARGCTRAQGHYYWPAMTPQALETLASGDARDGVLA